MKSQGRSKEGGEGNTSKNVFFLSVTIAASIAFHSNITGCVLDVIHFQSLDLEKVKYHLPFPFSYFYSSNCTLTLVTTADIYRCVQSFVFFIVKLNKNMEYNSNQQTVSLSQSVYHTHTMKTERLQNKDCWRTQGVVHCTDCKSTEAIWLCNCGLYQKKKLAWAGLSCIHKFNSQSNEHSYSLFVSFSFLENEAIWCNKLNK